MNLHDALYTVITEVRTKAALAGGVASTEQLVQAVLAVLGANPKTTGTAGSPTDPNDAMHGKVNA